MKILKFGVLGAGYIAGVHCANINKLYNAQLAAVCDEDLNRAADIASRFGNEQTLIYVDFEKMLAGKELDAVIVCLPPFAHQGQVEAAARSGIHVFVEKPIALDTIQGQRMVDVVQGTGVIAQVGYHCRFGTAVKKLKDLIDNGEAGMPTLFDGRYDCNSLHSLWWRDRTKSGGQVFEQAIHTYDMSMYLLGQAKTVCGFTQNLCHKDIPGYTAEDTSAAVIRFDTGALASISASNCAVPMEWNNTFTVVCKNLTAYFLNPNRAEFVYTSGDRTGRELAACDCDMYYEELKSFTEAIRGSAPVVSPLKDGLASLRLVEAVMKSSGMDGQPVDI